MQRLASPGSILQQLAAPASEIIWQHLGASGSIWKHLATPGSIWAGSIWHHLATSGAIWAPLQSDPSPGAHESRKILIVYETVDKRMFPDAKTYEKTYVFKCFGKMVKKDVNYRWEMLTCAKLSVHFTRCFEGQVHQVLYLSSREHPTQRSNFPATRQASLP